jgi:site-specific recombinase XerD
VSAPLPPARVIDPAGLAALFEQLRAAIRRRGFSPHTLRAYEAWGRRFVLFHKRRHPEALGASDVLSFLNATAPSDRASAATRNQALNALMFLYREVLGRDLAPALRHSRAKASQRVPLVLTRGEVEGLLRRLRHPCRLLVAILYGSGLRLAEGCRLRIRDVDFSRDQITVRDGKGRKDRATLLPVRLRQPLREHVDRISRQHQADVAVGGGFVPMPSTLASAGWRTTRDLPWQWLSPATAAASTAAPASCAGPTCTTTSSNGSSPSPFAPQESPSLRRVTRCATRSPRTSTRPVATSARSRTFSATRTSRRP